MSELAGATSAAEPGLVIAAVGDIHCGDVSLRVDDELRRRMASADVVIVNQETPLADRGAPWGDKSGHLRSAPAAVSLLQDLHATVAVLANNHICDWGRQGLEQTVEVLREAGIASVGAGFGLEEAIRPVIVERPDVTVGILAFAETRIQAASAAQEPFGTAPLELERMTAAIDALKARVDCVVVNVHWGYTNYHYPLPEHVRLGRELLSRGATLVIGHHPHVIQGVERGEQGAIAYSLGNFVFATYYRRGRAVPLSRENHLGMVLLAHLSRDGLEELRFVHTEYSRKEGIVRLVRPEQAERRERLLGRLSRPLADERYPRIFRRYVLRRALWRALRWLNPRQWSSFSRGHLGGLAVAVRLFLRKDRQGG